MNFVQKAFNEVYDLTMFFLDRSTASPGTRDKLRTTLENIHEKVNK